MSEAAQPESALPEDAQPAPQTEPPAAARSDRLASVPWGAVAVFVVLSFGLAWLVALPLWRADFESPTGALLATLVQSAMMFTPAIATLVVVFAMRAPRTHRARFLGLWPLRPAKRVVWFMVAAIFAPIVIVVLALGLSVLCGWVQLDLVNFSGMQAQLDAQLEGLDPATAEAAASTMLSASTLVLIQVLAMPFAALFNSFVAFGEELGWRGWLLPALRPLGVWPSLLVSGVIWGLWHAPVTLLGHNFGLLDWRGVALMVGGCVCWGVFFGWLRLRSASVWPAVIAHGSLNAAGGLFLVLMAAGAEPSFALVNPLGVSGWIVLAVLAVVLAATGQFKREPELAPAR